MTADRLRDLSFRADQLDLSTLEADELLALGCWRALWRVVDELPPLNDRSRAGKRLAAREAAWRGRLAAAHRDFGVFAVQAGVLTAEQVALPRSPTRMAQLTDLLESGLGEPDALRRAGRAWALLAIESPFAQGNQLLGALAAKWILTAAGVEPTAVSVLGLLAVEQSGLYQAALQAASAGDWAPWDDFFTRAVLRGCELGQRLTREIQAGRVAQTGAK